jgi:hypothetical protein
MKKLMAMTLILVLAAGNAPALDVKGMEATYTSGTVPGVRLGVDGTLGTTSPTALEFHSGSGDFSVPYAGITAARCREENRFRLGVLPAIAVGLIKARSKRHLMTITWNDERGVSQAAIFETSKVKSQALLTILRVRSPQICSIKGDCLGTLPN